jgi:hypothetical protein
MWSPRLAHRLRRQQGRPQGRPYRIVVSLSRCSDPFRLAEASDYSPIRKIWHVTPLLKESANSGAMAALHVLTIIPIPDSRQVAARHLYKTNSSWKSLQNQRLAAEPMGRSAAPPSAISPPWAPFVQNELFHENVAKSEAQPAA